VRRVYCVAACRTAVTPRHGALAGLGVDALAAPVIERVLQDAGLAATAVDAVVMGNALYGGGNPARLAALRAGLAEQTPAMTVDTQCCSGLDAIALATASIAASMDEVIVAGGLESWSRSPIRQHRPLSADAAPQTYTRPPFSPWPSRDPDLAEAAAELAASRGISRAAQAQFAQRSHAAAIQARERLMDEIVPLAGVTFDSFTRPLRAALCRRLPSVNGDAQTGLTAATIAVEADAAAAVLLVSERVLTRLAMIRRPIELLAVQSSGGDPEQPALAPVIASRRAMQRAGVAAADLAVAEVMEAYAVQAQCCMADLSLPPAICNRAGGGLARGHPIGASGAILLVRMFHELQNCEPEATGLATIAAAGGLGAAAIASVV